MRVPTLNGEEARAALRRLGADVALSLDNALIPEATFALPRHGDDQRPPRRGARTTAAARRCSGSSPTAATRSASPSTGSTRASTRGRCSRAGEVPIERRADADRRRSRRRSRALHDGEPRRARARARRSGASRARRSPPAARHRTTPDAAGLPARPARRCATSIAAVLAPEDALLGLARRARVDARRLPGSPRRSPRASGRGRCARAASCRPSSVIVAAHDEEDVIERRLENLLALDYPAEQLEVVVASDASTDAHATSSSSAIAARDRASGSLPCPRGGKVAAQNRAVRETTGEIVAFSDANATWARAGAAQARAQLRRPGRRVRLRPASPRARPTGRTARARTGATSSGVREAESALALGHGRQRLDLRRAARRTTSRSTRASATTSRSRT